MAETRTRRAKTMEEIMDSSKAIPTRYEIKASELYRLYNEGIQDTDSLFFALSKAYQYGFIMGSRATKNKAY